MSYDVKWPELIRNVGFHYFLKKSRNNGNWHKIRLQMIPKCTISWICAIWWRKLKKKKKLKKYLKTVEFWLDLHVIWLMPSQRQNVILMHTIEISTFLHRLKEELLKVSALSRKPSFQNFEKNLFGGRHPVPIAKRYCYKKMWIKKYFCASKNTLKFNIFPEQKQT